MARTIVILKKKKLLFNRQNISRQKDAVFLAEYRHRSECYNDKTEFD